MTIIDYLSGQPHNNFIDDNFGSSSLSLGSWPLPDQLADVLRPIYVASDELRKDPHRGRLPEAEFVPDVTQLLKRLAETRNTYGLAQLAADSAPHIELSHHVDESFNLVIGDSFADRLIFWNDRSRMPAYLGRQFTTLIVAPQAFDDQAFVESLCAFMKARNGVSRSSGTPLVRLKSASLTTEKLSKCKEQLQVLDKWNGYHVVAPASLDDTPKSEVIERAVGLVTGRMYDSRLSWREFPAVGAETRPPAVLPLPLQDVQSASRATQGLWAVDIDLERQTNLTRYSNVHHHWMLPRRLRMHGAFRRPYEVQDGGFRYSRSSADGWLALFAGFNEILPNVKLPNDETAFRYALQQGKDWHYWSWEEKDRLPGGAYEWSRPSDKGRYLIGTLHLFGGLHEAGSVLLHQFWKDVFDDLGGAIGEARDKMIRTTLKKRLKEGKIDSDDEWDRLTRVVANEAHQARMPLRTLAFDKLRNRFTPYLENERKSLETHKAAEPEMWLKRAEGSLGNSLKWLCGSTVLYQGYEWKCLKCFHTNWTQLGALAPLLSCEVCDAEHVMPVDRPWDFRLNGFIRDALKEHGLLALVWCLIMLEKRARKTFYFLGPHELYDKYPEDEKSLAANEADLICVIDGKVHLCEVKSSGRDIDSAAIINVAKRIRPDVVTLAIMEEISGRVETKFKMIKAALSDTAIEVELLTLEEGMKKSAHLPS